MEDAEAKRRRTELFASPVGIMQNQKTPKEIQEAYEDAIKSHPFVDLSEHTIEINDDAMFFDSEGALCGALIRNAIPEHAAKAAANVLRPAATRTSLRATIFGGEAPLSGIAGYYDYHGSPVDYKCRKTSFTCEVLNEWPAVFPMVEYVSAVYKTAAPSEWEAQNKAIPDMVRINNSPFSTLTINQRFRTASHTDSGDFDGGFGCLAVLEGDYEGLHLGFTNFKVCFAMRPRDVLLFNTHHFHANTELERTTPDWTRLSCVFYYRVFLGEQYCLQHYKRRWEVARKLPVAQRKVHDIPSSVAWMDKHNNGDNHNRAAVVHPVLLTPFLPLLAQIRGAPAGAETLDAWFRLHALCRLSLHRTNLRTQMANKNKKTKATDKKAEGEEEKNDSAVTVLDPIAMLLFGEESFDRVRDGLPDRVSEDKKLTQSQTFINARPSALGGFSEATGAMDAAARNQSTLDEVSLQAFLSAELFRMWKESRTAWLDLVLRDWRVMVKNNPDRDDFSWKNKSDMNTKFFELCDVAQQVMLTILDKEEATKLEENAFWLAFAGHLHHACYEELHMHPDAMSMKKLNVKLKDYNFGGTRYFKDMPPEEQQRRLERKKRIEDARRQGINYSRNRTGSDWLENDSYDYQSERSEVQYAANGWDSPPVNAEKVLRGAKDIGKFPQRHAFQRRLLSEGTERKKLEEAAAAAPCAPPMWDTAKVRVCVVCPQEATGSPLPLTAMPTSLPEGGQEEIARLLGNAAAVRSQSGTLQHLLPEYGSLLKQEDVAVQMMTVSEVAATKKAWEDRCDVVVLRFVCSYASDAEVLALIQTAKHYLLKPTGAILISDVLLSCRSYYLLKESTRDVYDKIAVPCFQRLLGRWVPSLRGVSTTPTIDKWVPTNLRKRWEWQELLSSNGSVIAACFSFDGSPRNTVAYVVS